ANITRRAPEVSPDIRTPLPNVQTAILAKAIHYRTSGRAQGIAHLLINSRHLFIAVQRAGATPVILQVVNAPFGKSACVLVLMTITAFITGARIWPRGRIDAELQAFAVNIISQRFHVGKLLVGLNISL